MTKLAFDLSNVASAAILGSLFGFGGAGLGSIIDMLAGTDRRWTKILSLLGLAGGVGVGGMGLLEPLFAARQWRKLPTKLSDIPDYVDDYRYIVAMRLDPSSFQQEVDHTLQAMIKAMNGESLYRYLYSMWPKQTPDQFSKHESSPYIYNAVAHLIPATDKRQFAIRHAAHLNLEMLPLQVCWKELDAGSRYQLFLDFAAYRDKLAPTADDAAINQEAENAFNTVVARLIQYGKTEHARALQILHDKHKMDVQELARQIQQGQRQPQ